VTRPVSSSASSPTASQQSSATLPPGHRWRTDEKVHTTFAAPETWTAIDAAKLGEASADSPELKEMADRMGVTVQQFKRAFANVELFLAGPPVAGFAPNINALVLPVAEMPSDAAIRAEIGRIASAAPTLRHSRTPVGDALEVAYPIKTAGRTVHVHSLLLDTRDGVLELTIAAPDEATASSLAADVLASVHQA
jgi:hypothetical protein